MNAVTVALLTGVWVVYLIWELVLLYMRAKGLHVGTISMEAHQHAYQMTVLPFIWGSMASHWWLNWAKPYTAPYPAIVFWVLVVATLALDIYLWKTPYSSLTGFMRVFRWPGTQMLLGLILGFILFPQRDVYSP
jgi:hypothetical protein